MMNIDKLHYKLNNENQNYYKLHINNFLSNNLTNWHNLNNNSLSNINNKVLNIYYMNHNHLHNMYLHILNIMFLMHIKHKVFYMVNIKSQSNNNNLINKMYINIIDLHKYYKEVYIWNKYYQESINSHYNKMYIHKLNFDMYCKVFNKVNNMIINQMFV